MSGTQASTADVTADVAVADISDAQFEKYFDSKGESGLDEAPEPVSAEPEKPAEPAQKETEQKQDKTVPYAALHEERMKRQELARDVAEFKQKNQRMEQRFQQLVESFQNPQPKPPSFDEDPLEALRYETQQLKQYATHHQQTEQQRQEQQKYQQFEQQFKSQYEKSAHEFIKEQPDFAKAYEFYNKDFYETLLEAGYEADQAKALMHQDEMAIAAKAFQDGVNPAERIYKIALRRGYKHQQAQAPAEKKQSIEQLEKGLQASKTLSNRGGNAESEITLETIANMDDEEFAKFDWKKFVKKSNQWR